LEETEQVAVILSAGAVDDRAAKWGRPSTPVEMPEEFRAVFEREITGTGGRVVRMAGEGVAAIFISTVGAVRAAVAAQERVTALVEQMPDQRKIDFRVGVHFGSYLESAEGDIRGDGADVAKHMEGLAKLGGVTVSRSVYDSVSSEMAYPFEFLGEHEVEGIADPVGAYRIETESEAGSTSATGETAVNKKRVLPFALAMFVIGKICRSFGIKTWTSAAAAAVLVSTISGLAAWQISGALGPEEDAELPIAYEAIVQLPDYDPKDDDCVSLASRYWQAMSPAEHLAIRDCLEAVVALDSTHKTAWGRLALVYLDEHRFALNPRPGSLDRAMDAGARAVSVEEGGDDEWERIFRLKIYFHRNALGAFQAEAERGIALNVDNARFVADLGSYMIFAGEGAYGHALIQKALMLNAEQHGWHRFSLATYHYQRAEYEQALTMVQTVDMPDFHWSHMYLAAIYGQLGLTLQAHAAADRLLELSPGFAESFWAEAAKWNGGLGLFAEGLRKAGLEIPDQLAANY